MEKPDIELYALRSCPYCKKVERKLNELDLPYKRHEVLPVKLLRRNVKRISGQRAVPVLVDNANGVEGMPESDDIVDYLENEYGDAD